MNRRVLISELWRAISVKNTTATKIKLFNFANFWKHAATN